MISPDNIGAFNGSKDRNEAWISEAIWGHRIERQPFSALMLEFLGMAEGMYRQDKLLAITAPEDKCDYTANRCLQLRNLLFNNPRMEEILRNAQGGDQAAWAEWLQVMEENASLGEHLGGSFGYLRKRFESFAELVRVVRLLRRISVDPGSERRWTVQFLFPIGPAALYEALERSANGNIEGTRRVFTRTGEIAYLMLSRAADDLRHGICELLSPSFAATSSRNKLVMRLIEPEIPDRGSPKGGTYLPYRKHSAFDRMAQDVLAILRLGLPAQDAFQYLQPLLGLHVYLYGIETANHWIGKEGLPTMICEILAPRSDLVRKASIGSYLQNDSLGERAVRKFLDQEVFSDVVLVQTLADTTLDDKAKLAYLTHHLKSTCAFEDEGQIKAEDPESYKRDFYNFAVRLYRKGTAEGLTGLATGCGLVSKRGTNRYRYAPTDDLLRALVLANVTVAVEERAFLQRIFERYRIVIGPSEAKSVLLDYEYDEPDFEKNKDRLTHHLIGMGLAQRMSDACTYVINPMDTIR